VKKVTLKEDEPMKTVSKLSQAIENHPARSAWDKGIKLYALELLEGVENFEVTDIQLKKAILNGAENWLHYSEGCCSLVYNADIAERLCTPSELKRNRCGDCDPNAGETWVVCQARALHQAFFLILQCRKSNSERLRIEKIISKF